MSPTAMRVMRKSTYHRRGRGHGRGGDSALYPERLRASLLFDPSKRYNESGFNKPDRST